MEIKEIENLASLCRIDLSEDEKLELLDEMGSILSFIDQVQTVKLDDKKDVVGSLRNVMREDKNPHTEGKYTEAILEEAPKKEGGYFKVKNIL